MDPAMHKELNIEATNSMTSIALAGLIPIVLLAVIVVVLIVAKNKMSTLGWIFSLIGAFVCIMGIAGRNEAEKAGYGYYQYLDNTDKSNAEATIGIGALILFFGIILIIVGYIRRTSARNSVNTTNNIVQYMTKCGRCGNVLPIESKFCSACGNVINTGSMSAPSAVKCVRCGNSVPIESKFCPACGNRQNTEATVKENVSRCRRCGNVTRTRGRFCPICGNDLHAEIR